MPFFVLSLKAGGAGLNLTAASHVVHFDRWWNPAVENQATDRAFRIGQTRNVLVHKFVCRGTVEEKIDQLIDSKRQLSQDLLEGGGEVLLTEMKRRRAAEARRARSPRRVQGVTMDYDDYYGFKPYVSVGARRAQAARELAKLLKKGRTISPVVIEGRKIAKTFWGKAWCDNLERYSDFANRLPRGRTYVRNGSVVDLQVAPGTRHGARQRLDDVRREGDGRTGAAGPLERHLQGLLGRHRLARRAAAGTLLEGRHDAYLRGEDGAVPVAEGILFTCSCPDWASMCKHVAAVLYGIGARLDRSAGAAVHAPQGRSAGPDCEGRVRSLGEGQATSRREGARER